MSRSPEEFDPFADRALALQIAAQLRGAFCWTAAEGWLRHDRARGVWESFPDARMTGVISGELSRVAGDLIERPEKINPADVRQAISAPKAAAVLSLLRDALAEPIESFDADPEALNTPNGVVDLRTGEIRPHTDGDRFTRVTGVPFDPAAARDDWSAALRALTPDVASWLQLRLGQAMTGHRPPDDRIIFLTGPGENGKSAIIDAVTAAGGSYCSGVAHRVLIADHTAHSTELMDLRGLRLAVLEELPEANYLNTNRLKTIVGTGSITARRMRRDPVTFRPSHALFVTTNYLPIVAETDVGTWRRLAVCPFPFRFIDTPLEEREYQRDDDLKPRLQRGDPAVLAWLIAGCVRYFTDPAAFRIDPAEVVNATQEFRDDNDLIAQFAEQVLTFDPDAFTSRSFLYEAYHRWEGEGHYQHLSMRTFLARWRNSIAGRQTREDRKTVDGKRVPGYLGVRLQTSVTDDPASTIRNPYSD